MLKGPGRTPQAAEKACGSVSFRRPKGARRITFSDGWSQRSQPWCRTGSGNTTCPISPWSLQNHRASSFLVTLFFSITGRFSKWFRRFANNPIRRLFAYSPISKSTWRIDFPYFSRPGGLYSPIRQFAGESRGAFKGTFQISPRLSSAFSIPSFSGRSVTKAHFSRISSGALPIAMLFGTCSSIARSFGPSPKA